MTRVEMTERLPSSSLYAMDEILQAFPWSWTAGQLDDVDTLDTLDTWM